jgi:hypothetical protein
MGEMIVGALIMLTGVLMGSAMAEVARRGREER